MSPRQETAPPRRAAILSARWLPGRSDGGARRARSGV